MGARMIRGQWSYFTEVSPVWPIFQCRIVAYALGSVNASEATKGPFGSFRELVELISG